MRMRTRIAVGALLLASGLVAGGQAAQATGPSMNSSGSVRDCVARQGGTTESYPYKAGCLSIATIAAGTQVTMICWRDDAWDTGTYRSNRWFYITAGNLKGFVHSSRVKDQTPNTPTCSEHRGVTVTRWSAEHIGVTDPTSTVRSYVGIPSGKYWSGYCAGFAHAAYGLGAGSEPRFTSGGSANTWLSKYSSAHLTQTYSSTINVGSFIFWKSKIVNGHDVTGGLGHMGIYVGNGQVVFTQGSEGQRLAIRRMNVLDYTGSAPSAAVIQPNV